MHAPLLCMLLFVPLWTHTHTHTHDTPIYLWWSEDPITCTHVQVLQKKFEEFRRDVNAGMERYTAANGLARRLVAEGHSDTVLIKEKQDTMRSDVELVI